MLYTNYALLNLIIQVKDSDGNVLYSYDPQVMTQAHTYSAALVKAIDRQALTGYINGANMIHIYAQLANGELVEAYCGPMSEN